MGLLTHRGCFGLTGLNRGGTSTVTIKVIYLRLTHCDKQFLFNGLN